MRIIALLAALSIGLSACAGRKTIASSEQAQPAAATKSAPKAVTKPLVKIGPDLIIEQPVAQLWQSLTEFGDWGAWNPHVTAVEPGFGLSAGAALSYAWDEKPVKATLIEVKEGETLAFGPAASGGKASLRWTLKSMGATRSLVSLRAEVPAGSPQSLVDKCIEETTAWISALKDLSVRQNAEAAATLKEAPPKKKRAKK